MLLDSGCKGKRVVTPLVKNLKIPNEILDFSSFQPISLLILLYINPKPLGKTTSTPEVLSAIPMLLWNVALELHVGRCYSPLLGPLSDLFVFLSGLLITLVLLSGYIILHRRKKSSKLPRKSL